MPIENMPTKASDLEHFNFNEQSFVDNAQDANAILNTKGKFSLDDKGNLIVINAKKDNAFVRFFKGLFNSSYRAEQRALDRIPFLQKNGSFLIKVTTEVLAKSNLGLVNFIDNSSKFDAKRLAITSIESQIGTDSNTEITPDLLKERLANTQRLVSAPLDLAAKECIDVGITSANINVAGKLYNAYDFVEAFPHTYAIPSKKEFVDTLVRHAIANPACMQDFISEADAKNLKILLAKPKTEEASIRAIAEKLTNNFLTHIGTAVQNAIDDGVSIDALAEQTSRIFQAVGRAKNSLVLMDRLNNPNTGLIAQMSTLSHADAPSMSAETRATLDAIKQTFTNLDDAKAAKLARFLDSYNIPLQKYSDVIANTSDLASLLTGKTQSGQQIYFIDNLQSLMSLVNASNVELDTVFHGLDGSNLLEAGQIIGFHFALNDQNVSEEVLEYLRQTLIAANSYQANEGDTFKGAEDWSIISKTIGKLSGFLTEQTRALHGTSCFDATEKDITDPNFKRTAESLMFLNRVSQSPEFAQILAAIPDEQKAGTKNYILYEVAHILEDKKTEDILSLNQDEILQQAKDKVFNNLNKEKICSRNPLSEADKNAIINDFARRDEGSDLKKISDIITKDDALDVRGFYKRFDWDAERNSVSSIQGEAITYANSVDSIKSKIEAIVPTEFIPSVSYLLQQGGLVGTIYDVITGGRNPDEVAHDTSMPTFMEVVSSQLGYSIDHHKTSISREGDIIKIKAFCDCEISGAIPALLIKKVKYEAELEIDLSQGVDATTKMPNSLRMSSISKQYLS